MEHWKKQETGDLGEIGPLTLQKKNSYELIDESESKPIFDIINRHNVKLVLAKKVRLTIGCLVR